MERWTRFWNGEALGRPAIRVSAPTGTPACWPLPRDHEDRFLGVAYNLERIDATLRSTWFGGEAIPFIFFNGAWVASSYTSTPVFHERTIWFEPLDIDFATPPAFALDWRTPWLARFDAFHAAMLRRAGREDFMIGQSGILPANDMLSMLMGTEPFLTALIDQPEWMRAALGLLARNWCSLQRHFFARNRQSNAFWYGPSWNSFWGPRPFIAYQADISCMISPDMFHEFILPEIDLAARAFGPVWYHLDGPGALPHLDCLVA